VRWIVLPLLVLCVGCTSARGVPATDLPDPAADDPLAPFDLARAELAATARFYEHEVRKNHTKARVMSVLAGAAATGAGASIGVLAQPDVDDRARPGIAAAGISGAVFSGLLAILPFAHQYRLKELGYARQATATWDALSVLERRCQPIVSSPDALPAERWGCVADAREAVRAVRVFPEDSPCRPPPRR